MSDFNDVDDQTWRDEPRVEDGEVTDCVGCSVTQHLHAEDKGICPSCAWEGWTWQKAYLVRRDDTVRFAGTDYLVTHEEEFGRRVLIQSADVMWMKNALDKVLVRSDG